LFFEDELVTKKVIAELTIMAAMMAITVFIIIYSLG